MLLDEPFASLDAHLRASVRADVQELLAETGITGVLVTHDQDEALSTADRVAVLRDGRIAQCDAPQDLYDRPADADIARFIGDANLIEGVLDAGTVDTMLGRLRVEPACLSLASARVARGGRRRAGRPGPARPPCWSGRSRWNCAPTARPTARTGARGRHAASWPGAWWPTATTATTP